MISREYFSWLLVVIGGGYRLCSIHAVVYGYCMMLIGIMMMIKCIRHANRTHKNEGVLFH